MPQPQPSSWLNNQGSHAYHAPLGARRQLGTPFDGTPFDGAPFDGSSFDELGTPFDGTPFYGLGTPFDGTPFLKDWAHLLRVRLFKGPTRLCKLSRH